MSARDLHAEFERMRETATVALGESMRGSAALVRDEARAALMGHNPIPPPPPRVPIDGDGEARDLDYCRELYALGHLDEEQLEARVERIIRGDRDANAERRWT